MSTILTAPPPQAIEETHFGLDRALRVGDLSMKTLEDAEELARQLPPVQPSDPREQVSWLKSISSVAFTFEHFGRLDAAREFWENFKEKPWESQYWRWGVVTETDFLVARSRCWVALAWVHHSRRLYAAADGPNNLIRIVQDCVRYVEEELRKRRPQSCLVTLGTCYALHGFLRGDCGEVAEADEWFGKAAEMFLDRLKLFPAGDSREEEERSAAVHRIARLQILGSAWLKLTNGALHDAHAALSAAKVNLEPTKDNLLKAFARMIEGCIKRAKAGSDPEMLTDAIKALEEAHAEFEKAEHRSYLQRASFELALAYFHLGEEELAKYWLAQAADAEGEGKSRWFCNIRIVQSRLAQRKREFKTAIDFARKAVDLAGAYQSPSAGESRVALGEALLANGEIDDAVVQIEHALDGAAQNLKLKAICCLHLADANQKAGKLDRAHDWFVQYRQLGPLVQHRFVEERAKEVDRKLNSADSLVISSSGDLDYRTQETRLRRFLLQAAKRRCTDVSEIVNTLGISKQTYYAWQEERPDQRGRPKTSEKSIGDKPSDS
jgi:tetratricopeptide (TPR) repeat protein